MKNMKVMDKETQNLLDYWEGESEIAAKRPPYSNHAVMDMFDKYIDLKGKKVLDVGCGYGNIFRLMKQRGAEPYGLDICPECIDNLKKLGFSGKVGDCREIPYKSNTFDVVYSIGVVEHFDETDQSIAEHIRVCKPGGKVIVMVPHLNPLYTPLAVLFYLFQGKILKYRYAAGKSYTKWHFRKRYPDARIESFYGSAFLKFMTKRYNKEWAERFERWLKGFGLFLWVEITKK